MPCMPSRHHATGLQTDSLVIEASPLMRVLAACVYILWRFAAAWQELVRVMAFLFSIK